MEPQRNGIVFHSFSLKQSILSAFQMQGINLKAREDTKRNKVLFCPQEAYSQEGEIKKCIKDSYVKCFNGHTQCQENGSGRDLFPNREGIAFVPDRNSDGEFWRENIEDTDKENGQIQWEKGRQVLEIAGRAQGRKKK